MSESISDEDICTICLEPLQRTIQESSIKRLECKHEFHAQCIIEWKREQAKESGHVQTKMTCPLCRKSIYNLSTKSLSLEIGKQSSSLNHLRVFQIPPRAIPVEPIPVVHICCCNCNYGNCMECICQLRELLCCCIIVFAIMIIVAITMLCE